MERTYRNQFPSDYAPPLELVAGLGKLGFIDSSWGNDVCPSWTFDLTWLSKDGQARIVVWIDHPDPGQRELPGNRYSVTLYHGEDHTIAGGHETDIGVILDFAEWAKGMARTIFADVTDMLGQNPGIKFYSDLHEVCDANVLGDFEEGCDFFTKKYGYLNVDEARPDRAEFDACRDWFFNIVAAVQNTIDWWMQNRPGPPRRAFRPRDFP